MEHAFEILLDRPEVRVVLTRDSVSAGDDIEAPHKKEVTMHSFVDPVQLAREASGGYLPSVAGSGHRWTCILNGTAIAEIAADGIRPFAREAKFEADNTIFFRYTSSTY